MQAPQPTDSVPNGRAQDEMVQEVPASVVESLDQQIAAAGGEWRVAPAYQGSIGRTMFDTPASDDGTVTVLLPREHLDALPRQALVRIRSVTDGRSYLGAVVKGPFAEPDGLRADTPIVVTATVHGQGHVLFPKYHGRAQIGLIGEELDDGAIIPPRRRPRPNSPVFVLDAVETAAKLRTSGDIRLGMAEGQEDIDIRVSSRHKSVFPRHLGILGTTGGGKSTTVSGLVHQFQKAGMATILLDPEGEYTTMGEPTDDETMLRALRRRDMVPDGVSETRLYHLIGRDTANPDHPRRIPFRLDFAELSPHAFKELLDLSGAQETRFFQAYEVCKLLLRDLGVYPQRGHQHEEHAALQLDELDTGYPRMTLSHVLDIAGACQHIASKGEGDPRCYNAVFTSNMQQVLQRVRAVKPDSEVSWRALLARLWRLHRLQVFDNPRGASLDYAAMLRPGCVSIIDLSDTDASQVNNLVIAQLLKGLLRQQDANYQAALDAGTAPTPAMLLLEEAHEFLSAQRIKDMPVLFQQVARMARRGRKRWLGLTFITQLPQHLPDEVFGLINNWILHKINDVNVVSRLRRAIGGIDDGLWQQLPNLAPGQALVSFTSLARPLVVSIDPTPCKLLMVE
jgi:hypothetical protein